MPSGVKRCARVVERRFKRYDEWAGLAFWLYLTRGWVEAGLAVEIRHLTYWRDRSRAERS